AKTINREAQIHAKVDGKKVIIFEASIRRDLQFEDEGEVDCLSNEVIFKQLTLIGYEKLTQKLTFYKAFFSPQWKFIIHTILQCLSVKSTAWNEFSSTKDSAIICLATNQKFNFSKYVFDSMVKHLDSGNKFLMYRSLGVEDASKHRRIADIDVDEGITLVNETAEDQGRYNDEEMFDTCVLDNEEVVVEKEVADKDVSVVEEVNAASIATSVSAAAITTTAVTIDELTL
nr:ribonuclease H-like domain, reverse transcriptase, RNA-dependent DNA polymerase [Tanacetum cinerariifolium]